MAESEQIKQEVNSEPISLREAVKRDKKKKDSQALKPKKINPLRMMTSGWLRSAWINGAATLGLTILWTGPHVLLRQIFGKSVFCKLGEEWKEQPGMQASPQSQAMDDANKMLLIAEPMGAACCHLSCLLIVLIILGIISMIAGVADFLIDVIKNWFTGLFSWW